MRFTESFNTLKAAFAAKSDNVVIEGSDTEIHFLPFTSQSNISLPVFNEDFEKKKIALNDSTIEENTTFNCPVFIPKRKERFNKAVILLHGLNEKSWQKYLPWGNYLSEKLNRPVILFPISFHMNRCPESWSNPRTMMPLLTQRQKNIGVEMSTVANIALSQRLSDEPLRFFTSGHQSAEDIVCLLQSIKSGNISFLEKDAHIDFFAYSIGAFLSQVLFLGNPDELLNDSRLFLFCGGAHFSEMYGTSRLIMDSQAYQSLRKFYLGDFLEEVKSKSDFSAYLNRCTLCNAFKAMITPDYMRSFRESTFQKLKDQIKVITLKDDKVIPANYVESTFLCVKNHLRSIVEVLDFPFDYSHEIPFPIFNSIESTKVDQCFERVFNPAVEFLA